MASTRWEYLAEASATHTWYMFCIDWVGVAHAHILALTTSAWSAVTSAKYTHHRFMWLTLAIFRYKANISAWEPPKQGKSRHSTPSTVCFMCRRVILAELLLSSGAVQQDCPLTLLHTSLPCVYHPTDDFFFFLVSSHSDYPWSLLAFLCLCLFYFSCWSLFKLCLLLYV